MLSDKFYGVNKRIRLVATDAMRCLAAPRGERKVDLAGERVEKILLVRANFRLGNSILALPAIDLFRKNFPRARIDFAGSPVSTVLMANLPVDRHYQVCRGFPSSSWAYPVLLQRLRGERYDLAVEVSGSQSALGAFIVGLSGARLKIGRRGKWDFWYDMKIPKPRERNKYRLLPSLVEAMGLESEGVFPRIVLSSAEIETGRELVRRTGRSDSRPVFGVFIGGRKRHGKRWPEENFAQVVWKLHYRGIRVAVFIGPEERPLSMYFRDRLPPQVPVIFEPSLRTFAAIVSQCELFLTGDSGPMHLACALGVPTIAIFQNNDFNRWGPPACLARIVYEPQGVSVASVEAACLEEWTARSGISWRRAAVNEERAGGAEPP